MMNQKKEYLHLKKVVILMCFLLSLVTYALLLESMVLGMEQCFVPHSSQALALPQLDNTVLLTPELHKLSFLGKMNLMMKLEKKYLHLKRVAASMCFLVYLVK